LSDAGENNLVRYVPRVAAEWDMVSPNRNWDEAEGSLVYVDISGFTALSEKLAVQGRVGAEQLTEILGSVFEQMLNVAYAHGGSLLKFGGDALLLLFRGSDHALQAGSAAVEMQAALRHAGRRPTAAGRLQLKMSVGIHSGPIQLFLVGDSHRELLISGPAASETTEMEETAVAGQILITAATKQRLPLGAADKSVGDGWILKWRKGRAGEVGWIARHEIAPEVIASRVPGQLRQHLGEAAAEPEHRTATVGFVRFTGVDSILAAEGIAAVADALHELITVVQAAVDAERVTFLATDLDQDGGKVILVAGVPTSREDNEGAVLRAARRIVDCETRLPVQIGINRGHVFAGEVGTHFRATYTVMGDTVNLAARLMAAAQAGEIYATPAVLERSHTLYATQALAPFKVKGKQQLIQAYAVGAETGTRELEEVGDLPFVGRDAELEVLREALQFNGTGRVITVTGPRGVGKTRLLEEASDGVVVDRFILRCEPFKIGTPYRVVSRMVQQMLGVEDAEPAKMVEQLTVAVEALDPDLLAYLPLVAEVAKVEVETTAEVEAIEPRFLLDRTANVVLQLLENAHPEPMLVVVDDAHWIDEASAHLLSALCGKVASHPWTVLVTRRTEAGGLHPEATELELKPFNYDESRALVIAATEAAPLRPHEIDTVVERSGGMPLYLAEMLRAVRRAGGVGELPESVDAVIGAEIDALDPRSRRLLRFASVLGRSFRLDVLGELVGDEDALDSAVRRELASFIAPDGPNWMRFRHGMVRDAAYEGLSFGRRRELHIQAGESIERILGGRAEERAADVLAIHFSMGRDHEKAWHYSRVAGDQAREAFANVQAAEHYERALEAGRRLGLSGSELADVATLLGDVREAAGVFDKALDSYRQAVKLWGDDVVQRADVLGKKARALERAGRYKSAVGEITRGRKLLDGRRGADAAKVRARLSALGATVRVAQQKDREAIEQALLAVEEAKVAGEQASLARAYSVLDLSYRWLGESEKAVHANDALAIYEKLNDLAGMAVVTGNLGVAAYFDGAWAEALGYYEQAQSAFTRSGNTVQAAYAEANIGEILVNQGRIDEAEANLVDALRVLRSSGFLDGANFAELQLGRVKAARGQLEEARSTIAHVRQSFLELGETASAVDATVHLAECYLRAGAADSALALIDESMETAGDEAAIHSPSLSRMRSCALIQLGRLEEAHAVAMQALADAEGQGLDYEVGLLLLVRAEIDNRRGDSDDPNAVERGAKILNGLGVRDPETVLVVGDGVSE
jgi:class 3 adenylate cyclase/tetratricopeptide (TPR) repeat protein